MNVVDSSAWLEYFADGPDAGYFSSAIEAIEDLVVPSITLYEVFKSLLRQRGEGAAVTAVASMMQGNVVSLDASLALSAARQSHELSLPMADSLILAVARACGATLWTRDRHFEGMPQVRYKAPGAQAS